MPSWRERFRQWRLGRRQYYMLDPDKLRPGDIIFSTERATESFFIRLFTWSSYSHAAIYVGDGLYAEAVDVGVRIGSVTTIVKERLKVIRLRGGADQEQHARDAADRIDHYLHSPYATGSALLSLFGSVSSADPRAIFCSQLVARAYADVGVAVVPGQEPEKITPKKLARSRLFDDVTGTTTFTPRAVPEYLLGGTFETLGDREVTVVEKMYRELCPFFDKRAIPRPRSWVRMLLYLADVDNEEIKKDLDLAVMKAMQNCDYIKTLRSIRDEVNIPLQEWITTLNPASLSDEKAAFDRFSFTHNLKALKRQSDIDLDNKRHWQQEFRTSEARGFPVFTFRALAAYSDTHYQLRQKTIALTEAALRKLGP